jgi:hypothetical protein
MRLIYNNDPSLQFLPVASTIQAMKQGRLFLRVYQNKKTGKYEKEKVRLFYDPHYPVNGKMGSLRWCKAKDNKEDINPRKVMLLSEMKDILLGMRTPEFRSSTAEDLEPESCFSLVAERSGSKDRQALNLCLDNLPEVSMWLFGLNRILVTRGKSVLNEEALKNDELPAFLANTDIQFMVRGVKGTSYTDSTSKPVFLFFEALSVGGGTFYWCEPGERKKSRDRSIPLEKLTDVYHGKQTDVFQSPGARSAEEDRCFSLDGLTGEIHFEADGDSGIVSTWMAGLDAVFKALGKVPMMTDYADDEHRHARVMDVPADDQEYLVPDILPENPEETLKELQNRNSALHHEDMQETKRMMQNGTIMTRFVRNSQNGKVEPVSVRFFYFKEGKDPSDIGAFYWCAADQRTAIHAQRWQLVETGSILLGKATETFRSLSVPGVRSDQCFSFIALGDETTTLDLMAPSEEVLSQWLYGFWRLINKEAELYVEDPSASQSKFVE